MNFKIVEWSIPILLAIFYGLLTHGCWCWYGQLLSKVRTCKAYLKIAITINENDCYVGLLHIIICCTVWPLRRNVQRRNVLRRNGGAELSRTANSIQYNLHHWLLDALCLWSSLRASPQRTTFSTTICALLVLPPVQNCCWEVWVLEWNLVEKLWTTFRWGINRLFIQNQYIHALNFF